MLRSNCRRLCTWLVVSGLLLSCHLPASHAAESWRVGFAKVDVTPEQPVRLSGYATRVESHVGVADPLAARAMVLSPGNADHDQQTLVLASIDSIAVSSLMTVELSSWLNAEYGIARPQFVLCSTHSHAAPHVDGALNNLYRVESTAEQVAATKAYTAQMVDALKQAITQALAARSPASLSIGTTEVEFAVNRRVLKNGVWSGFGEVADGPVDHRARLMLAHATDGKLLGAAFMYACHCTTLGGDFNQISGDWAGLASGRLEQMHAGSVFVPVIGCGADANPTQRGSYEVAQQHAAEMVTAIQSQISQAELQPLADFPVAHFGYAGLAPEQPTSDYVQQMAASEMPNERRWGEAMQSVRQQMGRLPETYPMPIHTWQFGDQLTWVFLGGEVVVDYQFQIEKELPTQDTWVAAYTDDVFAYVASEGMRAEGGYEVDFSMIYYLQPGRWQTGTQSLIVRRTKEILREAHSEERPLTAEEALAAIRVPDDYQVDLVAAEPLVQDPVNIAFGPDGRVWVVEMADYPRGVAGGGRVKWLTDNDGDGQLDEAHVFLSGLSYPSSVMPWKDGVLVIAAPDVLFATDRDGDGAADTTEQLLTGIGEANPQHRASGFEIGLDGWLNFSAGDQTKSLTSLRNGQTYEVHGRDVAFNPDTGEIRLTSGETQFVRGRDAFGNWFGNSNSLPMYQYVIEDRYLQHASVAGGPKQNLLTPPVAPPVLPRSRTLDRFNDLFALNRFTSACSSIVVRVPGFGKTDFAPGDLPVALICEPVHNLVARVQLSNHGSCFAAERHVDDTEFDFFTSTDPWSRPVRAINAPDGSVWILDMVRRVIEHPEWIPTAWQERLDLRGGAQLGRIYRVYRKDYHPTPLATVSQSTSSLLPALASENGAVRDLALQQIMHSKNAAIENDVRRMAHEDLTPGVRASALGCLAAKAWLSQQDVATALDDADPRIVRLGLELAEEFENLDTPLRDAINSVVARNLGPSVDLQWVLTSTRLNDFDALAGLSEIAARSRGDHWITKAFSLVGDEQQALSVARGMLDMWPAGEQVPPATFADVDQCVVSLWNRAPAQARLELAKTKLRQLLDRTAPGLTSSQLLLLSVLSKTETNNNDMGGLLSEATTQALHQLSNPTTNAQDRLVLVNLLGCGLTSTEEELALAEKLLEQDASAPLQQAVVEGLRRMRDPQVSKLLLRLWPRLSGPTRNAVGATLLVRREWTSDLVSALEAGRIATNELDLATVQRLRSYGDRDLRTRCEELFGKPTERTKVVAEFLSQIPAPVKTEQGEKLFGEHCAACHRPGEGKPMLGPPLENLGHWTLDQWVTAILDPNQAVEPKYRQSTLLTSDGQVIAGIVLDENPQETQIALSDGSLKTIPNEDIESLKSSAVSLMPEGFEQKLTPEQLSELLGFLRSR